MRIPGLTASSSKLSLRQSANNELVASTAIWKSFDSAHCCIPQSVAERAAAIPDRRAVVCGERAITYAELSMGASKKYRLEFYAQAFNLLNHANLGAFSGIQTSPFFGQATSAQSPRRIEVGLRMNF